MEIRINGAKVSKLPEDSRIIFFKNFEKMILSDKTFKMSQVFAPYRKMLKNFLKFNSVNGKNIILVDDYKTLGMSLKEIINKLVEAGANTISIFILIKN